MTKQLIFDAWAPPGAIWSRWTKPVLFSQLDSVASEATLAASPPSDVTWAADAARSTAIVVDLLGPQAVALGLSLAAIGYRPVPLYNACPQPEGDTALVDVRPIMIALASAAAALHDFELPIDAPPAFLLDADRNSTKIAPTPGLFDNRSVSLPTDFPSANFLRSRGILRAVLVQPSQAAPQADLSHTLLRWQQAGLTMLAKALDEPDPPRPITINRPSGFRLLWYNLLAKLGLKSSPLGGFGGHLPMPSSG